jgi:excisionase family DNA binding protein
MSLISIADAAAYLHLSPLTVRRLVRAGKIPCRKLCGSLGDGKRLTKVFFTQEDLDAYVEFVAFPVKQAAGD